ncbi:MAG: TonB-dependent receptor [Bacillota bacterium]
MSESRIAPFILVVLILISSNILAQVNSVTGKIFDSKTKEPLIGVNIIVNELKGVGTSSDINGNYNIKVPYGSYSVTASLIGYQPVVKTDVIVTAGSEARINIYLEEASVELQSVLVKADYFDKATKDNNLSTVVLGAEEIRRSPGSAQDFQRILQGMAGVSFSNDQNNELLVRGGSPNENLTVFDNMEIHSTNHYPNEHNSGGPINMINVDLIEDIQFSTGGFISKYGDKLSSVMNITSREGTRNNQFNGNLNLSMAGYGTVLEGRIDGGKGSWIVSARKSYLDMIKDAIGLTAVPKYWDGQFKIAYDLSSIHKLSFSGIYGNDRIFLEGSSDESDITKAGRIDSVGNERVDVKQSQYAAGFNMKSLWSKSFYSLFTLYYNNYHNDIISNEDFEKRVYNSSGKIASSTLLKQREVFYDKHDNGQAALKAEFIWNLDKSNELNFGGSVLTGDFKQKLYISGDSSRYLINNTWQTVKVKPSDLTYDIRLFDNYKYYAYLNDKLKLFDGRLLFNLGLRYDYFTYSGHGNLSPRLSATYFITPALTNINFAYGEYYQSQAYPTYGDREHSDVNKNLKNTHATHYVLGFEHIIDSGLKLTLEGYYKQYEDIPVSETFIYYFDRTNRSLRNLNVGSQKVTGIDFMLQQKLVKDIYGTLSISKMWSQWNDPRIGREGSRFQSDFDFPNIFTLIIGKRFANLREELNKMPFFIKYPSYLLPFSDDMEISLRWRYASGKPYTPRHFVTSEQHYEGEVRWSSGTWVPSDEYNSKRYDDYHRLDIAFSSRFNFQGWNISVFLSVENLYNRKNIAGYQYNSDGTVDMVYQFSLFPVAGIELEF